MKYNLEEPINIIFDAVEDLVEISELAGRPCSTQQIVDLGYIILSKNQIFRSGIRKRVGRPKDGKTWTNFKTTFVVAHQELRDTYAPANNLGYHSANAVRRFYTTNNPLIPSQEIPDNPIADDPQEQLQIQPPSDQGIANATQIDPAMETLITSIMADIDAMMLRIEGHTYSGGRHKYSGARQEYSEGRYYGRGRGRRRTRGRTRRGGRG